jgi:hypothetical protein
MEGPPRSRPELRRKVARFSSEPAASLFLFSAHRSLDLHDRLIRIEEVHGRHPE